MEKYVIVGVFDVWRRGKRPDPALWRYISGI